MSTKKDDLQEQSGYEKGYQDAMKLCKLLYPDQNLDIETVKKKHQDSHEDFMKKISKLSQAAQLLIYIQVMTIEEGNATNTDLTPYLYDVLVENPEWKNYTLENLEEPRTDKDGKQIDSVLDFLLKQIKQRAKADKNTTTGLDKNAIKVVAKKPNGLNFPVDKINRHIWLLAADGKGRIPGEITITNFTNNELLSFSVEGEADKRRGKERTIYYGIDPNPNQETTLRVSRKLTAFDRRVHDAIGTLYNVGNEYMSMSQIAIAMGNTGRPNSHMLERIEASIDKMMTVRIVLDQSEDYDAYNKIQQRYKGPLIAAEQKEAMINGQLVVDALHLFREPLLMEFARNRKQITTIPREVIETKKRQTENNLAIESYLLERISRMKGNKGKTIKKISYKSILKMLNLSGKQQQRAIPVIWDYLEHYKSVRWIKDYKKIDDGIEICL